MRILNLFKRRPKYRISLRVSSTGDWHWVILHENGEIIASSEVYASKQKCVQTTVNFAAATGFPVEHQ